MTRRTRARNRGGFIYLLRLLEFHKIGRSRRLCFRNSKLDCGPIPVEFVHAFPSDDAPAVERALHLRFAPKHVRREWFRLDPHEVAAVAAVEWCNHPDQLPPVLRR